MVAPAVPDPRAVAESSEDLLIHPHRHIDLRDLFVTLFRRYPRRAVLGLTLITSQAFLYNAIFFTYALVLVRFYGVTPEGNRFSTCCLLPWATF